MDGIVVQDFGHVAAGDKISCTASALSADFEKIAGYWNRRTLVDIIDEAGNVWSDMRVLVKSYAYMPRFPKVYKAPLEFWRI